MATKAKGPAASADSAETTGAAEGALATQTNMGVTNDQANDFLSTTESIVAPSESGLSSDTSGADGENNDAVNAPDQSTSPLASLTQADSFTDTSDDVVQAPANRDEFGDVFASTSPPSLTDLSNWLRGMDADGIAKVVAFRDVLSEALADHAAAQPKAPLHRAVVIYATVNTPGRVGDLVEGLESRVRVLVDAGAADPHPAVVAAAELAGVPVHPLEC